MASREYTAQEMREQADHEEQNEGLVGTVEMLRQAAEMRERLDAVNNAIDDELKKQEHCRKCEWRGKNIRSEPACPCYDDVYDVVFDIDVTDRIVKALRGDAGKEQ